MALLFLKNALLRVMAATTAVRHFRRHAVLEMFRGAEISREASPELSKALMWAAQSDMDSLLKALHAHPDGLTEAEAEAKRETVGLNQVQQDKPMAWPEHLWLCYRNPFNLLLSLLAAVSYFTGDIKAAVVISLMVVLSTALRFVQEARSNRAADKLKEMVSTKATVLRRNGDASPASAAALTLHAALHPKAGNGVDIRLKLLVPGDIVLLSAGDMIPADVRVLAARDLFVSQAALTGESLPVEKYPALRGRPGQNPLELEDICFMGTNVVSGAATALVVGTGQHSYFGTLAQRVTAVDRTPTAFQAGVNRLSWLLIRFMMVMTPVVLLLNGFTKGDWLAASLFALSVAVGLTPEMLPMIVTSTLAKGAVMLSRKKVVVKRLDAIQDFGAMDILCTDKTGTLTQDKIVLARHTDVFGEESDAVLEHAFLNSYYQTGLKNLLDVAVLQHVELHSELNVAAVYRKLDEVPFDFQRRRMSVVVAERDDRHILICKGALDEVVAASTHYRLGDQTLPLIPDTLAHIRGVTAALNEDGLRVVGVAIKELPPEKSVYGVADESDLVLIGYIAFLDPPKDSTAPALTALKRHGVSVKVLTGDSERVTAKICREVDLPVTGVLLGSEIERMSDRELADRAEGVTIFAKLTPSDKERIVRVLHSRGHVVGFMGDGINDAPALRAADVGISVDTAVDIAKEAADIILLEKSLMVLDEGVTEGRRTFGNMLKYIKMTASSNFGNVFSVLVASAFLPFLPMLPLQLLIQNLLYDISQVAIPFDNVDQEFLDRPQHWNPDRIGRFMVFFGPISSIFDILTFALLWTVFGANTPASQTLFQSGWFVEGLLSQTLIVHMIRTQKVPLLQSMPAWPLLGMTAAVILIGVALPMSAVGHYARLQPLPWSFFPWLAGILFGYLALAQAMKTFYSRRYGWQ